MITRDRLIRHLGACKNLKHLTQLHSLTIKTGLAHDPFIAAKLINSYSNFAPFQETRKLFDETPQRPVQTWNRLLKCYCRQEQYNKSLSLFYHLFSVGKPDSASVSIALKVCGGLEALEYGKVIHGFVKKSGQMGGNLFVGSGLVELYSKCGRMDDAGRVFEEYLEPDTVLWTGMITGYEKNGDPYRAIGLFRRMVAVKGVIPDPVTLVSVLSALVQVFDLKGGRSVHGYMIRVGFDSNLPSSNALLSLYAKMGLVNDAVKCFRKLEQKDVISWGSMIACYAHHGCAAEALDLFDEMIARGIEPNDVVLISSLQACEATCDLERGKGIHELARKYGMDSNVRISTALIDMYMICSSPFEAIHVFERMIEKDAVCYSAALHGCVQNGLMHKTIEIFFDMFRNGVQPTPIHLVKVLTACSELGALPQTSCMHGFVIKGGLSKHCFVGAALIDSYAKCGSLDGAVSVFKETEDRDIVVWSSMCAAYGFHGKCLEAVELFNQMVNNSDIRPNGVIFVSLLSACSHAGMFKEGIEIFNKMVNDCQLTPNWKHHATMVDLFGRIGELDEAMGLISQIQEPVNADVWGALLGACQIYQNMEMAEIALKKLLQLDLNDAGQLVLLSNIYAVDKKWENAAEIRSFVEEKQLKKIAGHSVI